MEHLILNDGSDSAALAKVALKALREARSSKTSSSGSIFVSDGKTDDDGIALGTGTIINGVNGGVQPWVGDTTPPGKPTGITAESHNGAIWVSWDGTLEGGIPADFDHVRFTAVDGSQTVDMGQLRAAGKVTAAELTAGDTVTITAIAYDDAHDAQGNSTPNASTPSDPVTVVVESAADAGAVQKAQSDAQTALNQAGQAKTTADGKNKIFSSVSEPSHTCIVPGDMWFQLDSNNNVSGIKVWNGSAFTDMVLLANKLLVASSVGTTQIADNAITTGKIAANTITSREIKSQSITSDNIMAGAITSSKLAANSVTADKIQAGSITADKIKGNRLIGAEIQTSDKPPYMLLRNRHTSNSFGVSSIDTNTGELSLIGEDDSDLGGLTFLRQKSDSGANDIKSYGLYITVADPQKRDDSEHGNEISLTDDDTSNQGTAGSSFADHRNITLLSREISIGVNEGSAHRDYSFNPEGFMSPEVGYYLAHKNLYKKFDSEVQGGHEDIYLDSSIHVDDYPVLDFEYVSDSEQVHGSQRFYRPDSGTWVGFKFALTMNYMGRGDHLYANSLMMTFLSQTHLNTIQLPSGEWASGQYQSGGGTKYKDVMWVTRIEGWKG